MDVKFCPLVSGSSGNSTYIGTKHTHILIDAGVSCKQIVEHLNELHVNPADLDAIFVTHEHIDHIKASECFQENMIYRFMQLREHGKV